MYSPIYTWSFIILAIYGIKYLYDKIKKYVIPFTKLVLIAIAICNILWLFKFRMEVSKQEFTVPIKNQNTQVELSYDDGKVEKFYIINKRIVQISTGKTILSNIDDRVIYNKSSNTVTGTLNDSRWFKIYIENDKLMLNISEKIIEIEDNKFFIFGMGLREKYLFKRNEQNYSLIRYWDQKDILNDLTLDNIDYENYKVYAKNKDNEQVLIYENGDGIYIEIDGKITVLDESIKLNIPTFEEYTHKKQLKILLNEVLVNITKEGPKPNFIAYDKPFYRDSAIVAMVLKETENISQIEGWIKNIENMYDLQNGYKEADNLGEVLYLMSLIDDKNEKLINEILEEADKLKNEDGYIMGKTDGEYHPIYQTKWLIYGLKSLNLEYKNWNIPKLQDSYEQLIWFDNDEEKKTNYVSDRWPYIFFAAIHYNKVKIEFPDIKYPISSEYMPSQPNFEKLKIINENYAQSKLIVPHSWSAAEMFLYLLDLDKGNI